MKRLPVGLQSLFLQCLALLMAVLLNGLLAGLYPVALWQFALVQGLIAAALSQAWRQPVWWPPLHFVFLPALLLAQRADAPSAIYLVAFLTLLFFYWSTFRTRVPLYLSDSKAWQALVPLLPPTQTFRFVDLGSGLGGVPLYLETRLPNGRFEGTEIAPAPWLISRLRARLRHSRVRFFRRDYSTLDLGHYDAVFAFLSPAAMPALWRQAQMQMHRGSLFISLSFTIEGRQPDHVVRLADGPRHTLYAWRM